MKAFLTFSPLERNSHIGIADAVILRAQHPRTTVNSVTVLKIFILAVSLLVLIAVTNTPVTLIWRIRSITYVKNSCNEDF